MPIDRFFIDASLRSPTVELTGHELHHLARVMRVQEGEKIELVNGKGELATAIVTSLGKGKASLTIQSCSFQEEGPTIILAQALTKPSNLEWIIEKGTELGASSFLLFAGERSEKKEVSPHHLERLHAITIAAMKQSGRLYLPSIEMKPPLTSWKPFAGASLFGDVLPEAKKLHAPLTTPLVFCVGPEKGFSEQETAYLRGALQAQGIKLHNNTLRAETAAIAALSQIYTML